MRIPRSRGAASGLLLILLGLWGALIPFVGPNVDFAYTPEQAWVWTAARGWLEVLPGVVTAVGGLLLLVSGNRATAMLGGWLTVLAGGWFVVGRALAGLWRLGDAGAPVAATETKRAWLELAYFSGLGAVIVLLGALALGRLSVRSVRDVEYAHRPVDHVTDDHMRMAHTTAAPPMAHPPATGPFSGPVTGPQPTTTSGPMQRPVDATGTGPMAMQQPMQQPRRRGFFSKLFHGRRDAAVGSAGPSDRPLVGR